MAWAVAAGVTVVTPLASGIGRADAATIEATYDDQGPSPITGGQVENVPPNNEVSGAVHTVVAHPTDPNILWIGTVNGGIWRTTNATAASPTWVPRTDQHSSLSISALELDPTVASNTVLVAGNGRYSSFGRTGGPRAGLLRTTNAGTTWTRLASAGIIGENISGIAPRGNRIVVSSNSNTTAVGSGVGGIFVSTDGGATFTRRNLVSGSGLTSGRGAFDLVSDPSNNARLYAGTQTGIFRSDDTGQTWQNVTNEVTGIADGVTNNIELAVFNGGGQNVVYAGIINNGQLNGLWRSTNQGGAWTQLDTPQTNEGGTNVGLHPREKPGSQGAAHFSIRADATNANLVYVGGDRQPNNNGFPNNVGANDFSGRLFRCDASAAANSQCTPLTNNGTGNNSSPHADSRDMVFDANGDLIEVDDGGVYRRTDPETTTGDWFSVNGNLQIAEHHSCAYDNVADIITCGNQDTGTPEQSAAGSSSWVSITTADGGFVAVDDDAAPSVRYTSANGFSGITRRTCNAANVCAAAAPGMNVGGQTLFQIEGNNMPLYPGLHMNTVDGDRLIVSSSNVYESTDRLDNLTQILPGGATRAVAYGGRSGGANNPGVLWLGDGAGQLRLRSGGGGAPAVLPAWTFGNAVDIVLDPEEWTRAFVTNGSSVYETADAGVTFTDITGSLATEAPNAQIWSLTVVPVAGTAELAVLAGTDAGVFMTQTQNLGVWAELGNNLPNTHAFDLSYDPVDDVVLIGTLGRGAWLLRDASEAIPVTDLRVTKSDTPDPVKAGQEVFYTVTVTNEGDQRAVGVVAVDDLPDEVIYLENNGGCTYDALDHQLTCSLGDLAPGQSVSFTIKTLVRSDAVVDEDDGTLLIQNTVTVGSASVDSDTSDNTDTEGTFVQDLADLKVTKVCKPDDELPAGETGTCTIYVDNLGPSSARDVVLRDTNVSDGQFTFGSITPSQGTCDPPSNGVVTCNLGDLEAASASAPGRATVVIEVSATEDVDINDVADVTASTPDPNTANNQARDHISVMAVSDLSLTKTGPADAVAGTQVVYGIEILNDGPSTAQGVAVEDFLSSGVRIVSVSASNGAGCNAGVPGDPSRPTTCNFGTLAPGATRSMSITAFVLPGTRGPIHNDARVGSPTFDDDLSDNLDTVATEVTGSADLSITKTDSPDPVIAGNELTYTIVVTNGGPSTAEDVVITDTLPSPTTFVSGVDGNGTTVCALVQVGTVVCDLGDLAPGQSRTVFLTVLVDPAYLGAPLANTAEVSSATADPDPSNNTAGAATTVNASADLWIDKQATSRSGNPSPVVVYTLLVHNDPGCETDAQSSPTPNCGDGGPSDATNVTVVDRLPLDPKKLVVQFVSPQCTYDRATHTVTCRTDRIPAGASVSFVIEAQVGGSVGTITNTAFIDDPLTTTPDPDQANNTNSATLVMKGGTGGRGGPR